MRIEGETLTYAELSDRLGITEAIARKTVRKARNRVPALTWENLRSFLNGGSVPSD